MKSWKVCTKWEYVSLINSKTVLGLYEMEIHQKISMPNYQNLKTMVKRIIDQKTSITNERIETGAVVTSRRRYTCIKRGQGVAGSGEQKRSREETSVVSGTMRISVQKRHKKSSTFWSTNTKRWKCVEKQELQVQESVWEDQSTAVQRLLERCLHQITLWRLACSRMSFL